jgi:hypothetical protein
MDRDADVGWKMKDGLRLGGGVGVGVGVGVGKNVQRCKSACGLCKGERGGAARGHAGMVTWGEEIRHSRGDREPDDWLGWIR